MVPNVVLVFQTRTTVSFLCKVKRQSNLTYLTLPTGIIGPRKANLVLIANASSEGSGEPFAFKALTIGFFHFYDAFVLPAQDAEEFPVYDFCILRIQPLICHLFLMMNVFIALKGTHCWFFFFFSSALFTLVGSLFGSTGSYALLSTDHSMAEDNNECTYFSECSK